ncbi:hypothetical protein FGG08_006926 [Glutinoglossum americanum]|uniref:NACHT domain-containing protein n=1 Tax=Glutinoglossum americanum TaxID=1670608 RepID=A0A9P8HV14_9PEZI|nr:hypothetical protein FGG08_006926 [Glutinoglossum americanum]
MRRWALGFINKSNNDSTSRSPTTIVSPKTFPSGIKLLHEGIDSVVDIIFVHGLTGDREKTWTAKNVLSPWPQSLLPSKIPNARVLTFGYDANVGDWQGLVSKNRIGNHAMNLLVAVATYRENDETVGMSNFGRTCMRGCKSPAPMKKQLYLRARQALVASRQRPEKHLQNILNSTRGIAFLGTPHHGAGLARWAEMLAKSIGLLVQANAEILTVLKSDSEVLARIQDSFHTMLRARNNEGYQPIEITCFFEEMPLPGIGLVVPHDSAILPGYIPIGIQKNHMDMPKFAQADDPGFVAVAGELQRWVKMLNKSHHTSLSAERAANGLVEHQEEMCRRQMIDQLKPLPTLQFQEKHLDLQLRRVEGLGQWLLNCPDFKAWNEGSLGKCTLWCHGIPGVGKTYLTSIVIDYLKELRPKYRVLYLYFDYKQQPDQTPFKILSCLMRQLLLTYSRIPKPAREIFENFDSGQGLPSWEKLMKIFTDVCTLSGDVLLVLDALDECDENTHRGTVLRLLENLIKSSVRLFITSRSHSPDINATLADCFQIKIEATESDLRAFLDTKIREAKRVAHIIDETLREQIIQSIIEKSQGLFLIPALQINNILAQTNKVQVRKALDELSSGLTENLDLAMERIKAQDPRSKTRAELAINVLMWLSTVKRPLTIDELVHAIDTTPDVIQLPTEFTHPITVVECCLGLIAIDDATSIVRLVHLSVYEYLNDRRHALFPDAHGILAIHCITYISLGGLGERPILVKKDAEMLLSTFPFLNYATSHWGNHAALCFNSEVEQVTWKFLRDRRCLILWSQVAGTIMAESDWEFKCLFDDQIFSQHAVQVVSPLHVAARFGIEKITRDILEDPSSEPNAKDSLNRTPLMLAAANGHTSVTRLLLSKEDTEVNSTDPRGTTALGFAVHYGQIESVQELVSCSRVDVNLGKPLLVTCSDYHYSVTHQLTFQMAKVLLARQDLDVNIVDKYQDPVWSTVARNWDFDAFQLIISRQNFSTESMQAPWSGSKEMSDAEGVCRYLYHTTMDTLDMLLNFAFILKTIGQDSRFPVPDFMVLRYMWTLVHYVYSGIGSSEIFDDDFRESLWGPCQDFRNIVKIRGSLENHGITLFMKDSKGQTFLHWAAREPREDLVLFLLKRGLSPTEPDNTGYTPLHWAARAGSESIVRIFLSHGANVNSLDNNGFSVLHAAALSDAAKPLIRALVEGRVDLNATDPFGSTILHEMVLDDNVEVTIALLEEGADANATSITGTPLTLAAESMKLELMTPLLSYGGDPNALDCLGRSSVDRIASSFDRIATWECFGTEHLASYMPTHLDVARRHVRQCLVKRINLMLMDDGKCLELSFRLGRQLMVLGDEQNARLAFQIGPLSECVVEEPKLYYPCSHCESDVRTYFICKTCPVVASCSTCITSDSAIRCRNHEYFEVTAGGWKTLSSRIINDSGQTREEWLNELREKFS